MFISVKAVRERADEPASERANEHFWPSGHLRMSGWSSASPRPGQTSPADDCCCCGCYGDLTRTASQLFCAFESSCAFIWFTLPYFYWFRTLKKLYVCERKRVLLFDSAAYVSHTYDMLRAGCWLGLLDQKVRSAFFQALYEWKEERDSQLLLMTCFNFTVNPKARIFLFFSRRFIFKAIKTRWVLCATFPSIILGLGSSIF